MNTDITLSSRPLPNYPVERNQGGALRAPRARRQRRALPLSGPPGTRRATPVKRANRLALTRRRPVRHAAVFSPPIVLLAATASRARLRAGRSGLEPSRALPCSPASLTAGAALTESPGEPGDSTS